ncbi:MAG: mismatch-specific DNA-glycosylase [Gammaproteobacteria bacterium]|nr:mismatch-specific DNA-glycosylase [Gammaproteobacteria bacterium]
MIVLSIGLNPSPASVTAGYYFAGRNNRFWPALNASGLPGRVLRPGVDACRYLSETCAIGFTDVVKRPSRGAADLRVADFRHWVPHLEARINQASPRLLWFHGKIAYRHYLRCRQQAATDLIGDYRRTGSRVPGCFSVRIPVPPMPVSIYRI